MPAPLKVDWSLAQSLFQEGLPLSSVSKRTGIPYAGLAKRSKRYGWKQLVLPPDSDIGQPLDSAGHSTRWQNRVLDAAHRHLSTVLDKSKPKVSLKSLEALARILDITDKTARRAYGLDNERGNLNVTLQVQSELPAQRQLEDRNEVLDVETVPNLDTPKTPPEQ